MGKLGFAHSYWFKSRLFLNVGLTPTGEGSAGKEFGVSPAEAGSILASVSRSRLSGFCSGRTAGLLSVFSLASSDRCGSKAGDVEMTFLSSIFGVTGSFIAGKAGAAFFSAVAGVSGGLVMGGVKTVFFASIFGVTGGFVAGSKLLISSLWSS